MDRITRPFCLQLASAWHSLMPPGARVCAGEGISARPDCPAQRGNMSCTETCLRKDSRAPWLAEQATGGGAIPKPPLLLPLPACKAEAAPWATRVQTTALSCRLWLSPRPEPAETRPEGEHSRADPAAPSCRRAPHLAIFAGEVHLRLYLSCPNLSSCFRESHAMALVPEAGLDSACPGTQG